MRFFYQVHLIFLAWSHTSWRRGSYWTITVFSMYEPWGDLSHWQNLVRQLFSVAAGSHHFVGLPVVLELQSCQSFLQWTSRTKRRFWKKKENNHHPAQVNRSIWKTDDFTSPTHLHSLNALLALSHTVNVLEKNEKISLQEDVIFGFVCLYTVAQFYRCLIDWCKNIMNAFHLLDAWVCVCILREERRQILPDVILVFSRKRDPGSCAISRSLRSIPICKFPYISQDGSLITMLTTILITTSTTNMIRTWPMAMSKVACVCPRPEGTCTQLMLLWLANSRWWWWWSWWWCWRT